jgi:hypothetical protein
MNNRGGYLKLYGLWDWYDSQSKEVQDYLYKSSGYGINTDPLKLTSGKFQIFHIPKVLSDAVGTEKFSEYYHKYWPNTSDSVIAIPYDERIPTATSFLCGHAMNAAYDKNHSICKILMDAAFNHAKSLEDSFYYAEYIKMTREKMQPSYQNEMDTYGSAVCKIIKTNPGILQSELKKKFSPDIENAIGLVAWALHQEGKVRREKKGRSFHLWIVE